MLDIEYGSICQTLDARKSILAAADHIERFPRLYRFDAQVPGTESESGSALGWIGYFSGQEIPDRNPELVTMRVLDCAYPDEFHLRMREINSELRFSWLLHWNDTARRAARCLRRYAELHHPD